jgi:mono/diheme cytochrome c family protein
MNTPGPAASQSGENLPDNPLLHSGGVPDLKPDDPRDVFEPSESQRPLSLVFIVFIGVFFAWAGYYTQRFSVSFDPLAYNEHLLLPGQMKTNAPEKLDPVTLGRRIYANTCAKCHQPDGLGLPGQYPPLVGSEWVLAPGTARLIRIVLDAPQGPIKVKGLLYNNNMTAWRDQLNDQQIAAVLTFIRTQKEWNHNASPVTAAEVAVIRNKTKDRAASGGWTEAELLNLPENEPQL